MTTKKNGGHIKSAQMTLEMFVLHYHEPDQALSSASMSNLLESIAEALLKYETITVMPHPPRLVEQGNYLIPFYSGSQHV